MNSAHCCSKRCLQLQHDEDDDFPDGFCEKCPDGTFGGYLLLSIGVATGFGAMYMLTIKGGSRKSSDFFRRKGEQVYGYDIIDSARQPRINGSYAVTDQLKHDQPVYKREDSDEVLIWIPELSEQEHNLVKNDSLGKWVITDAVHSDVRLAQQPEPSREGGSLPLAWKTTDDLGQWIVEEAITVEDRTRGIKHTGGFLDDVDIIEKEGGKIIKVFKITLSYLQMVALLLGADAIKTPKWMIQIGMATSKWVYIDIGAIF
eukprot:SAG11_NODE_6843_length_1237_cov_1.484183_2_plen_258_part_01